MSYILDALKKAAEQRGSTASVLLRPLGAPVGRARSWRVPWIVAGVLVVLNAAALVILFRPAGVPDAPPAPAIVPAVPSGVVSAPPAPTAPPAASAPTSASTPASASTPKSKPRLAELPPPAPSSPAPRRTVPPASGRVAAGEPGRPTAVVPPAVKPPAEPLVPQRPQSESRAAVVEPKVQPGSPPAPPAKTSTSATAERRRLKLEVVSYSDVPAQRLVFISGRKYVEGDTVAGGFKVEQIKEDSVVLSDQGERFTLRY